MIFAPRGMIGVHQSIRKKDMLSGHVSRRADSALTR